MNDIREFIKDYTKAPYCILFNSKESALISVIKCNDLNYMEIEIPENSPIDNYKSILTKTNNSVSLTDERWKNIFKIKVLDWVIGKAPIIFDCSYTSYESVFDRISNKDNRFYLIIEFSKSTGYVDNIGSVVLTNDSLFENWCTSYDDFTNNILMNDTNRSLLLDSITNNPVLLKSNNKSYSDFESIKISKFYTKSIDNYSIINNWDFRYYADYFFDLIKSSYYDTIKLCLPFEFFIAYQGTDKDLEDENVFFNFLKELDIFSEKNHKFIDVYIGCKYDKITEYKFNRINVYWWDSIDFFSKISNFNKKSKNILVDKLFTTFLDLKREWRCYAIDKLNYYNLLANNNFRIFNKNGIKNGDNVLVLENGEYTNIKLENFPEKDFFVYDKVNFIHSDYRWIFDEYHESAIDIVFETIKDNFFVTEKTIRPIFYKKMFLVISGQYFNRKLKDLYGFKLFDNIIDYSFDLEPSFIKRTNMLVSELYRISKEFTPTQIQKETEYIRNHNFDIYQRIKKNKLNKIPLELYNKFYHTFNIKNDKEWKII